MLRWAEEKVKGENGLEAGNLKELERGARSPLSNVTEQPGS